MRTRPRGSKLPSGAYGTEVSPAMGACIVSVEPHNEENAEGTVGAGGHNSQLGDSVDGGRPAASSTEGLHRNLTNVA